MKDIVTFVMTISVTVQDDDPGEADRLHRELYRELTALDVDDLELVTDPEIPPLAKADPANIEAIIVALASSPVLVQLGALLRDWVNRANGRKIVVKDGDRSLEITAPTTEDTRKVIDGYFTRKIE